MTGEKISGWFASSAGEPHHAYWRQIGRKLVTIRRSDAFDAQAAGQQALAEYERRVTLESNLNGDSLHRILTSLQEHGLVKSCTVSSISEQRDGYGGFWDLALPCLEQLAEVVRAASKLNDATSISGLEAKLSQVQAELPAFRAARLPPLARRVQRNSMDWQKWQAVLIASKSQLVSELQALRWQQKRMDPPPRIDEPESRSAAIEGVEQAVNICEVPAVVESTTSKPAGAECMIEAPDGPSRDDELENLRRQICQLQEDLRKRDETIHMLKNEMAAAPPRHEHESHGHSLKDVLQDLLETAMAKDEPAHELDMLADTFSACQQHNVKIGDLHDRAVDRLRELLESEISSKLAELLNSEPEDFWDVWLKLFRPMERCRHLKMTELDSFKAALEEVSKLKLSFDDTMDLDKIERTEPPILDHFQKLLDGTRCPGFFNLPGLKVNKVIQVVHERTRARYLLKRSQIVTDCQAGPEFTIHPVASQGLTWAPVFGSRVEPLESCYNEFYLFHGATPEAAESITDTDFIINWAAPHGCTFGRGVYMAEFSTHAQMFAQNAWSGNPCNEAVILVCRAICGRVQDVGQWATPGSEEGRPDWDDRFEWEANVASGKFHCTSGKEWEEFPSLREFIFSSQDQVLPEFILHCCSETDTLEPGGSEGSVHASEEVEDAVGGCEAVSEVSEAE
eukprot:gb/GFBE01000727.1/.p1 GENE.gb/GFBE01000727.1/~~gb/GFBE01000727.1/.p1  ORF type:complete len:681 (+),score=160.74 gb/GFBE01000727.1/:1-2043(+)